MQPRKGRGALGFGAVTVALRFFLERTRRPSVLLWDALVRGPGHPLTSSQFKSEKLSPGTWVMCLLVLRVFFFLTNITQHLFTDCLLRPRHCFWLRAYKVT